MEWNCLAWILVLVLTMRFALAEDGEPVDARMLYERGMRYYDGDGVPQDREMAVQLIAQAAEAGLAEAQNRLGAMYTGGEGVEKDDVRALERYQKAADQGFAKAQFNLGSLYYNGCSVEQDYASERARDRRAIRTGIGIAMEEEER